MKAFRRSVWVWPLLLALPNLAGQAQGPQRTTATYEDWTVSCAAAENSNTRSCEIASAQMIDGQSAPASQITIARSAEKGLFRIFVQVPANLWVETGLKLTIDDQDPGVVAHIKWCVPSRCLADAGLQEATVERLRTAKGPGLIHVKDAVQRDLTIPVSFKGFSQALGALEQD